MCPCSGRRSGNLAARLRPALALQVAAAVVCLSLMTVHLQVFPLGLDFIESGTQIRRHLNVLRGTAPGHWQYRLLSEWLVHGAIVLCRRLELDRPVAVAFILFRILQNLAIFSLCAVYYRRLGLGEARVLLGMSCLAWGMTNARYDSDLSLNTFSDMIFYLVAALLILARRDVWLVPLCVLAALNRETAGLIPLMALLHRVDASADQRSPRRFAPALLALAAFAATYFAVHWAIGPRPEFPSYPGHQRGIDTLLVNLHRRWTWSQLLATNGWLPFLALAAFRRWPPGLRAFFWAVVPAWYAAHFAMSVVAETRLMLVPLAIVFVPGALLGLEEVKGEAPSGHIHDH